jgi:outer membrane protein OmpA-like peptidoglycan-associated protein
MKKILGLITIIFSIQAHSLTLEEMGSALGIDPISGNEVTPTEGSNGSICEAELKQMRAELKDTAANIYEIRETSIDLVYQDEQKNKQTITATSLRFIFHFDNASTSFKSYQKNCLKKVLTYLKAKDQTNKQMTIVGYASSSGTKDINDKLSKQRAQAVWDQLNLVDPAGAKLVKVHGAGSTDLLNANYELIDLPSTTDKKEDPLKSRRVEFKYSDKIDEKFFNLPTITFLKWDSVIDWDPKSPTLKTGIETTFDHLYGLTPSKQIDIDYRENKKFNSSKNIYEYYPWPTNEYMAAKKESKNLDATYTENRAKWIASEQEVFSENNNKLFLDTWIMLYNMGFGSDIKSLTITGHAAGKENEAQGDKPCSATFSTKTMKSLNTTYINYRTAAKEDVHSYNSLSLARAKAVKEYLFKKGLGAETGGLVLKEPVGKGCTDKNKFIVEITREDGTTTSTTIKK